MFSASVGTNPTIQTLGRLASAYGEIPAIEDRRISSEHWEKLISVDQTDEGSASLLTTGDQRSLISLGNAEGLDSFRDEIRGRVVCLESALLLLVKSLGAQSVGEAFQRLRGVNTKTDVLFGFKSEFSDEETVRQLSSYLVELRGKLGDDFLFDDPDTAITFGGQMH